MELSDSAKAGLEAVSEMFQDFTQEVLGVIAGGLERGTPGVPSMLLMRCIDEERGGFCTESLFLAGDAELNERLTAAGKMAQAQDLKILIVYLVVESFMIMRHSTLEDLPNVLKNIPKPSESPDRETVIMVQGLSIAGDRATWIVPTTTDENGMLRRSEQPPSQATGTQTGASIDTFWVSFTGSAPDPNLQKLSSGVYAALAHRPAPCPFCGAQETFIAVDPANEPTLYGLACENCQAKGPNASTIEEATKLWDRQGV